MAFGIACTGPKSGSSSLSTFSRYRIAWSWQTTSAGSAASPDEALEPARVALQHVEARLAAGRRLVEAAAATPGPPLLDRLALEVADVDVVELGDDLRHGASVGQQQRERVARARKARVPGRAPGDRADRRGEREHLGAAELGQLAPATDGSPLTRRSTL